MEQNRSYQETAEKCLAFIRESATCFQAVETIEKGLRARGFCRLKEKQAWEMQPGGDYYVKRNGSSLIALRLPEKSPKGFHIVASHSDSPSFKLKPNAQTIADNYIKLNVEPYGGMIHSAWMDRPLSIAGRIVCLEDGALKEKTVNLKEDLLIMPNVAIHMNREMNQGVAYNQQIDLQPILGCVEDLKGEKAKEEKRDFLMEKIAHAADVKQEDILGSDLFLYVREEGRLAGLNGELLISPRIDDLECVFASGEGFLLAKPSEYISVYAVFDNEEVGSLTKQGAASTFLRDVLERTAEALSLSRSDYLRLLADSFLISADNGHGVHPNHGEKADPTNRPFLNGGIVIKYHGSQKYATDAYSEAVMKQLCLRARVPFQTYCNRSDIPGGSTLGNISAGQVSVPCADIGLAQLSMHSAMETAGSKDVEYLVQVSKAFFEE